MNELWSLLTDYFSPYRDCGVTLPSGTCKLIHLKDKRVKRIVERREYFQSRICPDKDCVTTTEIVFYRNLKRKALFADGRRNLDLVPRIQRLFIKLVDDFARTVKPGKEDNTDQPVMYETSCDHCDTLIHLLEFGKITALNNYPRKEYDKVMSCYHGGQAVGHHMSFFLHYMIQFFIGTKLLLYNNVEISPTLDRMFSHACDGQTFMPYHRQYLHLWMKDLEATKLMCKAAFRCIYLFVYLRRKLDPTYNIETDRYLELGYGNIYLRCFR